MYPLLLDTAEYSLINFVSQADCDVNHMLFSPNEEYLLISGCQTMLRDSSGSIIKKYPYSGYPVFHLIASTWYLNRVIAWSGVR